MGRFLRELALRLYCRLPWPQAREVLADYREYFATGLERGQSEAELCARFGPPRAIVQALCQERALPPLGRRLCPALLCLVLLATAWLCGWPGAYAWWVPLWALLAAPALLWWLPRRLGWAPKPGRRRLALGCGVLAGCLTAAGVGLMFAGLWAVQGPQPPLWARSVGVPCALLLTAGVGAVVLCWGLLVFGAGGRFAPALGFLCGGAAGCLSLLRRFLWGLDTPDTLFPALWAAALRSLALLAVGGLLALAVVWRTRRAGR